MSKTVPVSGTLSTTDPTDTYPLLDDASLYGGFRVVANSAVREGIPIARRKLRMEVKEIDSGKTYELIGGLDNSFWIEKISGSADLTAHINDKNNPHDTTKEQVGLGNVDNTSDLNKPISNATQLALNGKEDKLNKNAPSGYAGLGGDGKVLSTLLPSYIDDVVEYPNIASFPRPGVSSIIYVDMSTPFPQKQYRWSGSTYVEIVTGAVASVNGEVGVVTLTKGHIGLPLVDNISDASKNVLSATKLTTPRTINGVPFDGSQNIVLPIPTIVDEVYIGRLQPTTPSIKIWIKHEVKDDLYYLRQIRDANPTSQLPTLWRDNEDPYTQWDGVVWELVTGLNRVKSITANFKGIITLTSSINKLNNIQYISVYGNSLSGHIDMSNMPYLASPVFGQNNIESIDFTNSNFNGWYQCSFRYNKFTSMPFITGKPSSLSQYYFEGCYMPIWETNRIIALGYDPLYVLPQNS